MLSERQSSSVRSPDSADRSPAQDPLRHWRCQSSDRQWKRAARDSARTLLPDPSCAWIRPLLACLLLSYCKHSEMEITTSGVSHSARALLSPVRASDERHAQHRETRKEKTMQHI